MTSSRRARAKRRLMRAAGIGAVIAVIMLTVLVIVIALWGSGVLLRMRPVPGLNVDPTASKIIMIGGTPYLYLSVKNPGTSNVTIQKISISDDNNTLVTLTTNTTIVAPGESKTLEIKITGASIGKRDNYEVLIEYMRQDGSKDVIKAVVPYQG